MIIKNKKKNNFNKITSASYLVLASDWRITVKLVDNDWVLYIIHLDIFKTHRFNVTGASLLRQLKFWLECT